MKEMPMMHMGDQNEHQTNEMSMPTMPMYFTTGGWNQVRLTGGVMLRQ